MTAILIINAISCLLASAGVVGFVLWQERNAARKAVVRPLYVTRKATSPRGR
jgi:hypothetical protein